MRRLFRAAAVAVAAAAFALVSATPASAVDEAANCLGADRSDQGGFPTAEEFAQALADQLQYDLEVGYPGSTGQSLAYAAVTDCGG